MGRFNFESPGAAFTSEMAKVLAERKAEERQKMLDNLTKAGEDRANQQLLNQKAYQDAQIKSQQSQDERARVEFLEKGLTMEDDPEQTLSPDDFRLMREYQRIRQGNPTATPVVSTEESFKTAEGAPIEADAGATVDTQTPAQVPTKWRYIGTQEQREKERKRRAQGETIVSMLTSGDEELAEKGKMLARLANLNDGEIPAQAWSALIDSPTYAFDHESGDLSDLGPLPGNSNIINRSRPPRDPAAGKPKWGGQTTADGHPIMVHPDGSLRVDETVKVGGKDIGEGPLGIPQGRLDKHEENHGLMGMDVDASDITLWRQSARSAISMAKQANMKVKELARMYVNDPLRYKTVITQVELTPQETAQLAQLIDTVVPPEFEPILIKFGPKPKKTSTNPSNMPGVR